VEEGAGGAIVRRARQRPRGRAHVGPRPGERVPARHDHDPRADATRGDDGGSRARLGGLPGRADEGGGRRAGQNPTLVIRHDDVVAACGKGTEAGLVQRQGAARRGGRLGFERRERRSRRVLQRVVTDDDPRAVGLQPPVHHPAVEKPFPVPGVSEHDRAPARHPLAQHRQVAGGQSI
jgi:hypothetical protein